MDQSRRGLVLLLGAVLLPRPAAPRSTVDYGGPITRAAVVARAEDWLRRRVPYSQDNRRARWDVNRGRRYRPDCSGLVCMAWAVDPRAPRYGRALTTWELPRVCTPIGWAELQPGDILLRTRPGHVRLFTGWADPAHTLATVIETRARTGGVRRATVRVEAAARRFRPYRYRKIRA